MRGFMKAFEKQWLKENKPYGLEIHHHRLGGMLNRIDYCKKCLIDYANGKSASIPELEEDRLPYFHTCEKPRTPMNGYSWGATYTACRK